MTGTGAPTLDCLRPCLEGAIPGVMATCAADGTPNVSYVSQVYYVDGQHVALSFQFFNKTRTNILANPQATVLLIHPATAQFFRLQIRYLRTEAEGPVFEQMKAQLAGIASHTGMAGVFVLRGADVYRVDAIDDSLTDAPVLAAPRRAGALSTLRRYSQRLARCNTLDELLGAALDTLAQSLDAQHAMVLMLDTAAQRLYTVASCGYPTSGIGSEIELGDGVIGVAASARTAVRIGHMTNAYLYSRATRSSLQRQSPDTTPDTDIPYPGLSSPHSQLAVPMVSAGRLLGVVFTESPLDLHFSYEEEDMLVTMASHLAAAVDLMQSAAEPGEATSTTALTPRLPGGAPLRVRRYRVNNSVFIDDVYLIKGVAGAVAWKLLNDYQQLGCTEFSNRELRLDPSIGLPDLSDNLEARLILLQRRLQEHGPHLRIEKTGRGRFRLMVERPVELAES